MVQEFFLTKHSLEMFFDVLFFPLMNVVLFGLITRFVAQIREATTAQYLIVGILLWEIVAVSQYIVTVSSLWSVWSHNLTNIFIAPISVAEYLIAHISSAAFRAIAIFAFLSLGTRWFFNFNILHVGIVNLTFYFINLSMFAWALGIVLLGLIFRFGTRIQAVAWGVIFLFQPLTATYFPVAILPSFLRAVAYSLPPTYVFEAARQSLTHSGINYEYSFKAFALNIVYLVLAWLLFKRLFRKSRETGQFARNDL
jgi:ABC-2 type transport system permease protein